MLKLERRLPADPRFLSQVLISLVVILTSIGTVMVFSASFYQQGVNGDGFFFLRRQILWIPIAILTAIVAYQIDYRLLARHYLWIFGLTSLLLATVFVPGVGRTVNSSTRWIQVGTLQFQPSELAKLAAMVFVAGFLSHDLDRLHRFWKGFVPLSGGVALLFGLVLIEPDLGTAMFILGLAGFLTVLSGVRKVYLFASGLFFAPAIGIYGAVRWEMIQNRLLGFLEPEKVYQVHQSLLALGNGGWTGLGLGAGRQKLKYLPEPQTDFIFSIIGEELGVIGSWAILALFVALLWTAVLMARRARDYFAFLVASGITISLALQAVVNIAVVTASVPTKGIPLPFITFGGSGLCMSFAQIGLLLGIDRQSRESALDPAATEPEASADEVGRDA